MLDGHETVQIACGKVRWEGAIQHASLGNGFGRAQCRAVGAAFSELLARFFQDKCHHCDCPEKIVDPRLVKRSQDRSNGVQRLKNRRCTAKRLLLEGVSFG